MRTESKSNSRNAGKRAGEKSTHRSSGIPAAAAARGVDRTHLWRVLTGRRESRSLVRRYRELEGQPS